MSQPRNRIAAVVAAAALTLGVMASSEIDMPAIAETVEEPAPDVCSPPPVPAPQPAPKPSSRQQAKKIIFSGFENLIKAAAGEGLGSKFEFAGWVIKTVSGTKESNPDFDDIKKQLDAGRQQMDQLQKTLAYTCETALESRAMLQKVVTNTVWAKIEPKFTAIEGVIGSIETTGDLLSEVLSDQDAAAPGTPLSRDDLAKLATIRQKALENMNDLNAYVTGTPGNKDSLAELYGAIIEDTLSDQGKSVPSETGVYFTEYLHPLYDEINFYAAAMTKNMQLLAESYHAAGADNQAQLDQAVAGYLTRGGTAIDSWYAEAAPTGSDIPDGTFVDTRGAQNGVATMWSATPVAVDGQRPGSYCYVTTSFCFENLYTADHAIMDSKLVPTGTGPLPSLGGFNDWTLPTVDAYDALAKDSTGGLSAWFGKLGVQALVGRTETSHLNGQDSNVSVVGPLLARDGADKHGVVHWNAFPDDKSPSNQWTFTPVTDAQNQLAGQIFMTREYVLSGALTTTRSMAGKSVTSAKPTTARHRVTIGTRQPKAAAPSGALGTPVYFSDAISCAKGTTYTVPDGARALQVAAVGGHGGDGTYTDRANKTVSIPGGYGGEVVSYLPVVPGTVLHVQVGAAGGDTQPGIGGGGTGGATASGSAVVKTRSPNRSGGGGGASGVSADADCSQWLAVGAGGGGGGSGYSDQLTKGFAGGKGGDACATLTSCDKPGRGADDIVDVDTGGAPGSPPPHNAGAGAPLTASPGALMKGGNGSDGSRSGDGGGAGGGGGAGYFSGGGGGGGGVWAGGGGGAGGANWAINADENTAVSVVATEGQEPSVVITPMASMSTPMALAASAASLGYDEDLTLTAMLPLDATGTVGFYDQSIPGPDKGIGTAKIVRGVATLTNPTRTLDVGSHRITASYGGDNRYTAADASPVTVTVVKEAPTLKLTSSAVRINEGDTVSLSATIAPLAATGTIAFYDADQPGADHGIGLAPLNKNGVATLTTLTKSLAPGNHHLTAYYDGAQAPDNRYSDAESAAVVIYVQPALGKTGADRTATRTDADDSGKNHHDDSKKPQGKQ